MPRTSDWLLDCVIYIYDSLEGAKKNDERVGGSGFLAAVRLEQNPSSFQIYAVTAAHVIQSAGTPFLRLNKRFEESVQVLEAPANTWTQHRDGDDITVCSLDISTQELRTLCIETERFVTKDTMATEDIGLGDDVFMVGRFVHHSGGETQNIPSLRFGNISVMNRQPIKRRDGILQESFLVECHSVPGYSGSPVFVYKRQFQEHKQVNPFQVYSDGFWLLGIDWCHLSDSAKVFDKQCEQEGSTNYAVRINTGMAGVIPAWKILEIINSEEAVRQRRKG
jgi:hypothetical protein